MPPVRPAFTEYAPLTDDNPDLQLWLASITRQKQYYTNILAEDIFRCFVLRPQLCPAVPSTRFNMHLIGARADALFRLANTSHLEFLEVINEHSSSSTQDLADSLTQAFGDDIRECLPDAPPLEPVLFKVDRYIRSSEWFGNTRVLLKYSWTKEAGFSVASNAPVPHGKEIPALWGERTKVPLQLAKAMKRLANCSGRSLCANGTQLEVLCGPLAFVNCACEVHANIRPHGIFGLLTCGSITTLVPEDFSGAIPHQGRLLPDTEMLLFYGKDYACKLPCSLCSDVIPAHSWQRLHELQRLRATAALKLARKEAKLNTAAARGEDPSPCAPPGSAHLYATFTPRGDRDSQRQPEAGHVLFTERAESLGTFNFVVATLNLNARMAGLHFTTVLGEVLYQEETRHSSARTVGDWCH